MAKGVYIEIAGLTELKKKFGQIPSNVEKEIDGAMYQVSQEFVNNAVQDAPVDQGALKNEITFQKEQSLNYVIVSGAEYSAYIEFGTRGRVNVPTELTDYASQFRGNSASGDAKKMIFDWCQRKGIEPKYWFQIFISIMTNGIRPHPFFFKQLPQARADMLELSKEAVKTALGK